MKRKLLFAAILAIAGVWTQSAWAQAPTFAGWTQVESLDDLDNVDDNYYVVLDAVSNGGFAMVNGGGEFYYQTTADPNVVDGEVWIIEKDGEYINFKSMLDGRYINTGNAGWNFNHNSTTKETANFTPTLADGVWTFQAAAVGGNNYMGPWDGTISVSSSDGQARFAYNKATSDTHTFLLYSMPRTTYATVHAAAVDYNAKGWKAAQAAADLAVDGNYYIVVDGRSGEYLMSAGRSRPSFMAYNDPLTNKNMLWTMSPYGEKYNFKNEDTGKYLRCYDSGWDTGFSDSNNNDDKAFTLTLADGKWNMQRTNDYMFTWRGGSEKPYQTAYIAGNKSASDNAGWYIYSLPSALGTSYAQALPADGTMAADTWYFFDNEFANDYGVTTDDLSAIEYVIAGATTSAFTQNADNTVTLEANRYYVKSSAANHLVFAATSYAYNIGAAVADPADGSIIKAGQTISVTFTASTNDPSATLTKDFSGVTFGGNAVTWTETDNGFSFVVPATVTAGESYELVIPAGAVAYTGKASSAAASFFYSTPVLADGVYYFRNTDPDYEYKYISRGGSWSTQAIVGDFGLATRISVNAEGKTYIQFFDNDKYLGDTGFMYTDCTGTSRPVLFTVEKVEGGYKFKRDDTNYLALYQGQVVADGREGDNLEGTTNVWALETPDEYTPTYARNAAKQVQAVVDAAGIEATVTTGAELEALFALSRPVEISVVARTSANNKYAPETSGGGVYNYFNQKVTGLAKGVYKLKFHAMQRGADYTRVDNAFGARGLLYAYANDAQTQLVSSMEQGAETAYSSNYYSSRTGLNYPNNSTSTYAAFDNDLYWNEVYVYVSNGTLEFGINNPSRLGGNYDTYTVYGDFSLTYFYNDLTGPWREALAAAKATAAKEDKMAPSLRTALETTIATYDEGQVDETSQEDLDAATEALLAATAKAETSIASYAILAQGGLPNNSVEGWAENNNGDLKINTWSNEDNNDGGSGFNQPFIENWINAGNGVLGAGKLYYRLEGLEPGEVYYVEMNARTRREVDNTVAPVDPVFYVNTTTVDFTSVATFNQGKALYYGKVSAGGTVGEDGVLEFGIRNTEVCNYNWNAVKDVKFSLYLDRFLKLKEYADFNVAATSDDEDAQHDFATAIAAAVTAANSATTAAEIDAACEDLRTAMDTYVDNTNPVGDGQMYKLTYKLTNPDVTDFPSWKPVPGGENSGWYTEQNGGNFQVMNNDNATSEDGTKTKFVEYWTANAQHNNMFDLYTKVQLPEGTYKMTCYAVAKDEGRDGTPQYKGVYFYVDDTQGSLVDDARLTYKEVEFVNTTNHEVKVGLKATDPNTYNWVGIGYVELYKVPTQFYTIGSEEWDVATEGAGTVILDRAINVGYNAYVLPFGMTQEEVETYFGEGSVVKLVKEFDADNEILKFKTSENGIVAHQPCIVNATAAASAGETEIPARMIIAGTTANPVYEGTAVTMTGCYDEETDIPLYSVFVQGAKLVFNESTALVYSTRAYIELEGWNGGSNGIKGLTIIDDDGEATGIAVVENGELKVLNGQAYDLSGRAVKNPAKGLYIIDGKKVLLK